MIDDHAECGLPAPSLIRTSKIMTIEGHEAERRGAIGPERLAVVRDAIRAYVDC